MNILTITLLEYLNLLLMVYQYLATLDPWLLLKNLNFEQSLKISYQAVAILMPN